MKRLTTLIAALLVISLTSMMLTKENVRVRTTKPTSFTEPKPLFHRGMITIKVNKGIGEYGRQVGEVSFGISSLDEKADKFEVNLLEKRFHYNPKKLKEGLPALSRIYRIEFPEKYSVKKVAEEFAKDPNIEYAEPIPVAYPDEVPDDALYDQCQHLPQIFAEDAWEIHKGEYGTEEIVIALIDTGVDWDHEDLGDNVWQNLGEDVDHDGHTLERIGGNWVFDPGDINNFDDDGNGMADDFIGWNFYTSGNDPNPEPGMWHGTHCAGIAAGVTDNGIGIASISWNVLLMPTRVCDEYGYFPFAYDAIIYAAENGADIISNSWGGAYSQAGNDAVQYAIGLGSIVVASAGNENRIADHYPSDYPGVVSVASVNVDDTKASYSSFGPATDISAPGGGWEGGILSTMIGNTYGRASGTSMACPLMSGCFGLLKSYHPDWANEQLIIQMIGSADDIDALNPDYQHMLGSGRVNAYRMLTESATMPQTLKLALTMMDPVDADGDSICEPGELVTLNLEFRNYVPYVGEDDVTVTIETDDPEITILNGSSTADIPPDGNFTTMEEFTLLVNENAGPHFTLLTIHFETEIPVVYGQDMEIQLMVAPSGIFIFEGKENFQDYSGTFIKNFLDHLGYEYTYANTYPHSLKGFETVFLSHANTGQNLDKGTLGTVEISLMMQEFMEYGGNLYLEINGLFSGMAYFGYPNLAEMMQLFGVSDFEFPVLTENPIDSLIGLEGSPFEGMVFTGSNQFYNWYIDNLTPAEGTIIPFYENGYGNVSIMNDGAATFGHKAFYLSYSLAELIDRDANSSRYNVLLKIMEFFEYEFSEDYILSDFIADKTAGGSPLEVHFTDISLSNQDHPVEYWEWDFDNDGTIDSYAQNPVWTYNNPGIYDVKLITSNGEKTDTLIKEKYISSNQGYLVYDGVLDGDDYSGVYINEYLEDKVFVVQYCNDLPESLDGYNAVFLSYGTYGSGNTELNKRSADIISSYLQDGGYVYLEGGDALGWDQAGNAELLELLGIASTEDGSYNLINSLEGQPDALTHDMLFTSSQQSFQYIDKYEPDPEASMAFEESDYGTVAVQYTGAYGQKTFCFAYALACLDDGTFPSTRGELLRRICMFFDFEPVANFTSDKTFLYAGDSVHFSDLSENAPKSWEWFFEGGTPVTDTIQHPVVVYDTGGVYDVKLIVTNIYGSDTLLISDYICVGYVGLGQSNSPEIKVYPNPANNQVIITSTDNIQSVEIMNNTGKLVAQEEYEARQVAIDTAHLPNGIYFVRLKTGGQNMTEKVVVMR